MAKPLKQQPDEATMHEQVREAMRQAHTNRMAPVGIVFSQVGYTKAHKQTVPGMTAWGGLAEGFTGRPSHYLGLPMSISDGECNSAGMDFTLELVPGGSAEAKQFRATQGLASVNRTFDRSAVRVTAKGPMDKPTIEVLAEGLTTPQICDLVIAWATANPDEALGQALRVAVERHGRFE